MKTRLRIPINTIILTLMILVSIASMGQIVPSDCNAPDSILKKYEDDADRLALRKIYRQSLTYTDSIYIPKVHSDTVLNALIAVYNATTLPARDTVVTMFDIHSFSVPVMNSIYVCADSNLSWMQQLKAGNIPTGNLTVDSIISLYDLNILSYSSNFNLYSWHTVSFITDSNYNLPPLADLFDTITGVVYSEPNGVCCDGNNISDSVYTSHVELIYSVGWGDCMAGCVARRFWKFNVYPDCSVEFIGSYGNVLPLAGIGVVNNKSIAVKPNPFKNSIVIDGISGAYTYTIADLSGKVLIRGRTFDNRPVNLDGLTSGVYFLSLQTKNRNATFKLVKE